MRQPSALLRALAVVLLMLACGGAWSASVPCGTGAGGDDNSGGGNDNQCATPVITITGPTEIYVGETNPYVGTTNSGQMGTWTWTANGGGEVAFKLPPGPDGCKSSGPAFIDPCTVTSTPQVIGVKQGKVTLLAHWTVCGDSSKFCDCCATYDIVVLDNLHIKPVSMPLGGKFRRVDVHGVPMPDPSPTGEGEQDRMPNMAYTDMYTLSPTYAVTDMAVPLEGGELALEFRRTLSLHSRDYNPDPNRRGVSYPSQDFLGLGWDLNLGSRVIVSTDMDAVGTVYTGVKVIDETGSELDYIETANGFTPDISHSYNTQALRATLAHGQPMDDGTGRGVLVPTLVLTKTHQTTLVYSDVGTFTPVTVGDRCGITLARSERCYRLESVSDRNHNTITYQYQQNNRDHSAFPHKDFLVPKRIFDKAHPERALTFTIAFIAAAFEGEGLDTGWRIQDVSDALSRKTSFAYADVTGLHQELATVTRPKVEDSLHPPALIAPVTRFVFKAMDLTDATIDKVNPGHGPVGVNRFAAPMAITDAQGNTTSFAYTPQWFPTAVYANLGNIPIFAQRLIVTDETTVDGTAHFSNLTREVDRVTTAVKDTRQTTTTTFDFTSSVIQGLPTPTGTAIVVTGCTRTTSGDVSAHVTFTWSNDLNANLTSVLDMSGNRIDFSYTPPATSADPYSLPVTSGFLDSRAIPNHYQLFDKPAMRTVDPGMPGDAHLKLATQYGYDTVFNKERFTIDAKLNRTDEVLDGFGNRTEIHEPLGKVTKYTYDGEGFITGTTDPDQRVTVFAKAINATDLIAYRTVTTTVKGVLSGANPQGDVSITSGVVADVMGNQRTMIDPRGFEVGNVAADFTTTAVFDDLNRQVTVTKPKIEGSVGGALMATTSETHYDLNGNVVRTIDDQGNVSISTFDLMNRLTQSRRRMTSPGADSASDLITKTSYTAVGLPKTTTDAKGFVTDYAYDSLLRLTTKTLPTVTLPSGSTARFKEQYSYGANAGSGAFTHWSGWQPTRVLTDHSRGDGTVYQVATDTAYDTIYRPVRIVSRLDDGVGRLPTDDPAAGEPFVKKTYNEVHKVLTEEARNETFAGADQTRTTTYTYDALYRVTATTVSRDGGNLVTQTGYDLAGDVTSTTDAETHRTDFQFDGARRQRFVTQPAVAVVDPAAFNPANPALRPVLETRYDAAGNAVLTIDANHTQTQMTYDRRNRLTSTVIDVNGDGRFDAGGFPAAAGTDIATVVHYNLVGKPVATRDGRGNTTTTAYDAAYRVVQVTQPAVPDALNSNRVTAPTVKTAYDANGNVTDMTDPRGFVTHTTYDELNRVRTVTQAYGVTPASADTVVTESQYDAANNVVALILHNTGFGGTGDQKTVYAYDALNRKQSETLPSPDGKARVTTMAYYRSGQLRTSRDPLGQVTELEYDRAGRMLISRHKRADGTSEETRAYQYNNVGKPLVVDDLTGRTSYGYDALYRVTSETRLPASGLGQAQYAVVSDYDARGTRTRVTYPGSSRVLVSTVDRAGRIVTIQDAGRTTRYTFDANGNRLSVQEPNGVLTDNTLDALNRCTTALAQNASALLVSRYDYSFDLVGNRTRVDENLPPQPLRSSSYTYDSQYRLTGEASNSPAFSNIYTYDPAGNRQKLTALRGTVTTITTYVCDALNRLLSSATGTATTTYGYDLNGNQISQVIPGGPTISFVWDTHNRLVGGSALSAGSGTATASYDYRTRRQSKTVAGVTTFYRYDQGDSFQELGGSAIKQEIIRGSGMGGGIGSILYTDRTLAGGPVENFAYNPSVGHVTSLTNATGTVTETNRFDAFGNIISTTGTSSNNHLANTKERDASLPGVFVLDNHGMRYYNPVTGRYISRDPMGVSDGANVYLYVHNNPINKIDPLGLWGWSSVWTAILVVEVVALVVLAAPAIMAAAAVVAADIAVAAAADGVVAAATVAAGSTTGTAVIGGTVAAADIAASVITGAPSPLSPASAVASEVKAGVAAGKEIEATAQAEQGVARVEAAAATQTEKAAAKGEAPVATGTVQANAEGAKRGPKTDPTAPHNATIRAEADRIESEGGTILAGGGREKEQLIPTPGGFKDARRPDILHQSADGEVRATNVGKTEADGVTPVRREREALQDLNDKAGIPTNFVPYDTPKPPKTKTPDDNG